MQLITLRELEEIMRACAGEDESAQPLEQAPDRPFDELGYDSLALLETQSRISRDYGVEIPEEDLGDAQTPRELVDLVNRRLQAA
ncbi:acyl carrier protein [Spirillospora sp. NPDC029432]|uniref:acyl carrier protein n=1 Tax=Spirillospora sp. NPDC029432 TaxID=3154599 RepID=UPI0034564501